jgi:hypothetical protein
MDLETFLVAVYCLTDDTLHAVLPTVLHTTRLRQRGPTPRLADSEVVTMEIAGEFLGLETDSGSTATSGSIIEHCFLRSARCTGRPFSARRPISGR